MMQSLLLMMLLLSWNKVLFAQVENTAAGSCPPIIRDIGRLNSRAIYGIEQREANARTNYPNCYFRISNASDLGRSYTFNQDGSIQVFDAFARGSVSQSTGMRSFYIFPRRQRPQLNIPEDHSSVSVTLANGQNAIFSSERAGLSRIGRALIHEPQQITRSTAGQIDLSQVNALILDMGFQVGGSPASNPRSTSVFRDPFGQTCSISNSLLFENRRVPRQRNGTTTIFRFSSDQSLAQFLATRCPRLDISSLNAQAESSAAESTATSSTSAPAH